MNRRTLLNLACAAGLGLLFALPPAAPAQTSTGKPIAKSPTVSQKETPAAKQRPLPFRGKLVSIDKAAASFKVGKRTFQVTRDTRIERAGKPARLEDGVVGEPVTGSYRKSEDGKLMTGSLYFGGKSATNSPAR